MKKVIAIALTLCLALTLLAGCTGNEPKTTEPQETKGTENTENTEAAAFTTIEEGKLIMGTNAAFPPYELVADGEGVNGTGFEGIDVEIALAIAEKLGLELVIDDQDFDAALTAVQTGKCDCVLAGLTYTEERDEIMDFTTSYAKGVQVVIVKEGSEIATIDDLANAKLIGTQRGTTGYIYCSDTVENGGYGEDHVAAYDNGAMAVQALLNGQIDCVVIDNNPAQEYVAQNEGLKILDTAFTEEDYCIAVGEGNTALQNAINTALEELIADGTVQTILDKYIKA